MAKKNTKSARRSKIKIRGCFNMLAGSIHIAETLELFGMIERAA
jgi:hypothetical protein